MRAFERAFGSAARQHFSRVVVVTSAQAGKALALDTPLPTPSGWTTMGDVRVGDRLFDERGQPCLVVATSPVMVDHDCYRVHFSDGSSIVADAEHRWTVDKLGLKRHVPMTVTVTTAELIEGMHNSSRSVWAIPVAGALDLPDADLPIAPYVFGYWLGDGHSYSGGVSCGDQDVDATSALLRAEGADILLRQKRTAWFITIDPQQPRNSYAGYEDANAYARARYAYHKHGTAMVADARRPTFYSRLSKAGLIGNKHIPSAYLRASKAQRLALLQGLMDSDGTCGKKGSCELTVCSGGLAYGAIELIRSLGFKPTMTIRAAKLNGRVVGTSYRIQFMAYSETPVFRLARKRLRQRSATDDHTRPSKTARRFITRIEKVESVPVKCVKVDTPSHLYLAGEAMVPTHNTEAFLDIIGERLDNRPAPILYVGPSKDFLTDQFEPRLVDLFRQARSLAAKLPPGGVEGKAQKKVLKKVAGVRVRLAHAGSSTALKSDPAALAIVDEYDEMLRNIRGQGDPLGLVEARGDTYADFQTGIASTPSLGMVEIVRDEASGLEFWQAGEADDISSPIWRLWQEGTRHHFCWPCPNCGEYFVPRSKQLRYAPGATPAQALRNAWLECPNCGFEVREEHKAACNARGEFVAPGEKIDAEGRKTGAPVETTTLSYWVSGLCSPFKSIGDRAAAYLRAIASGESDKVQTAVNAGFGELYLAGGGELPEWQEIAKRREDYEVPPEGAIYLTAGVDVQSRRLPFVIRAWGAQGESWLIERGEILGDTADLDVWDALSEKITSPIGDMLIKLVFVDSGFRPGKKADLPTHRVYEFCRRFRRFVFPSKGSSGALVKPLTQSKIEVTSDGKQAKYGLDLIRLDTDHWKSYVHERLRCPLDQPGAWRLNDAADEDYCRQLVAEARVRGPSGKAVWIERNRENHALDCEAMAAAAAYMLNVQHLRDGARRRPLPDRPVATLAAPKIEAPPAKMTMAERMKRLGAGLNQR